MHDLIEFFTSDDFSVVENELVGTFEISDDHSQGDTSSETHLLSSNLTTNPKSEGSHNIVSLTMSDDNATSVVQGISQVSTCNANDQQISEDEKHRALNTDIPFLTRTKSSLDQRSNSTTCNANDQQISVDEKHEALNNETPSLTRTKSSLDQRSNSTTDSERGQFQCVGSLREDGENKRNNFTEIKNNISQQMNSDNNRSEDNVTEMFPNQNNTQQFPSEIVEDDIHDDINHETPALTIQDLGNNPPNNNQKKIMVKIPEMLVL